MVAQAGLATFTSAVGYFEESIGSRQLESLWDLESVFGPSIQSNLSKKLRT